MVAQSGGAGSEKRAVGLCLVCKSEDLAEFTAEAIIHFHGLKNADNPGVLFLPKVLVCLDCGFGGSISKNPNWRSLYKAQVKPQPVNRMWTRKIALESPGTPYNGRTRPAMEA